MRAETGGMSLREAIALAVRGEEVPSATLEAAFGEIMDGKATAVGIAALLVALRTRGETVGEIVAAARALRRRAVTAPCPDPRAVDTCGTGGDGANTFNVSTAAAFVVAGAGVPVAKHGNRAASSRTGSIDVLEALGVRVDLPVRDAAAVLAEVGIAPFFARRAHPAMRFVAPVREELGIRTLMNCLGPLLNPVGVRFQLVGVFADDLVEPLATALGALGAERALVVHGSDGLDEITVTGSTRAALLAAGEVEDLRIEPQELGVPLADGQSLRGGDAEENAAIVRSVLDGEPGPRRDIVTLNAAAALWVAGAAADLAAGLASARHSIDSGAARERLERLVRATRR
jgi:anthranilate phosphoribosyltransferase